MTLTSTYTWDTRFYHLNDRQDDKKGRFWKGPERRTYFGPELDGGGAVVRLPVGVVRVQHHLDGRVQVVHAHHRLAGHSRGDDRSYLYSAFPGFPGW